MRVNILTNNDCPNSRAFNCPLLITRDIFSHEGISLGFHFSSSGKVFDADCLFINSNVFRYFWPTAEKDEIFKFLEEAKKNKLKIIWFDTSDSTWITQFEVLPYVDTFLKGQILVDRDKYLTGFRTGRIFTDFFDELYHCEEKKVDYPFPQKEELNKIGISWNTCFENYMDSRYTLGARIKQRLRPLTNKILNEKLKIDFTSCTSSRENKVSCRVGLKHSRPSVVAHRQAIIGIMKNLGINCEKIPLPEYFEELRNSQIGIGPFGVGEITLRDFEVIICGATLIKPDMSHMETWPELFVPGKTFIPHQWDLSDLEEKVNELCGNPDFCQEIALNAQKNYKKAISPEGQQEFVKRLQVFL